jgi:3-oxoacyl-[acyl-carrier-protein] synthase II
MKQRVAVTGIGVLSPLGNSVAELLSALQQGRSGIVSLEELQLDPPSDFLFATMSAFLEKAWVDAAAPGELDAHASEGIYRSLQQSLKQHIFERVKPFQVRYVGVVKQFSPELFLSPKDVKRTDRFQHFAMAASELAKRDAGLEPKIHHYYLPERTAVVAGSSMGGLLTWEEAYLRFLSRGPRAVSPFFMTKLPADMAAGEISRHQEINGPVECPTAACATGALVVGRAFELVQKGVVDVALATASEASLTHLGLSGFEALKALSTRDYGDPTRASRPFDRERSGFIMAEGGACLLLENLEKARKRGAMIYAEIAGFGNFADAYHPTQPDPEGKYAAVAMQYALREGELNVVDVDYINAHGTSTPLNDRFETKAIKKVFGVDRANRIPVSSTKSLSGHLMGAAGAFEVAVCALALCHQFLPPTANYEYPDPECDLADYVPNQAREAKIGAAISNSFGFGGRDATIALRRYT